MNKYYFAVLEDVRDEARITVIHVLDLEDWYEANLKAEELEAELGAPIIVLAEITRRKKDGSE